MTQQPDRKAEREAIRARLDRANVNIKDMLELAATPAECAYEHTINDLCADLRTLLVHAEEDEREIERQREELKYVGDLANRHAQESHEFMNRWRRAERQRAEDLQKSETAYLAQAAELASLRKANEEVWDRYTLGDTIRLAFLKHGRDAWCSIADEVIAALEATKNSQIEPIGHSEATD